MIPSTVSFSRVQSLAKLIDSMGFKPKYSGVLVKGSSQRCAFGVAYRCHARNVWIGSPMRCIVALVLWPCLRAKLDELSRSVVAIRMKTVLSSSHGQNAGLLFKFQNISTAGACEFPPYFTCLAHQRRRDNIESECYFEEMM